MIELYLPLDPADIPSAQQKGVLMRYGKVIFYEKKNVREMRQLIGNLITELTAGEMLKLPSYRVTIVYVYRPLGIKSHQYGQPKVTRPDIDNVTKIVLDAISDTHIAWDDDNKVSTLVLRKRYAQRDEEAFVYILIEEDSYETSENLA